MLKIRKKEKTDYCLNCSYPLPSEYDFCPKCGQKNINNNPTFWELMADFFQNYFSLDSKMGRSIKPFFFKPGYLTNRFNEGKRVSYVNPIRLYLIISFFYFFILGIMINSIEGGSSNTNETEVQGNEKETGKNQNGGIEIEIDDGSGDDVFETLIKYADVDSISDLALMDSLNIDIHAPGDLEKRIISQLRRAASNTELLKGSIAKNLPIMMFLLLPIFAMILKLIYVRRKLLYIRHLVHSLHLHSFAFIIFGLTIIFLFEVHTSGWVALLSCFIVFLYTFFSFKNVYNQSTGKTFLKLILLGFTYFFLLTVFVLSELLLTFLYF